MVADQPPAKRSRSSVTGERSQGTTVMSLHDLLFVCCHKKKTYRGNLQMQKNVKANKLCKKLLNTFPAHEFMGNFKLLK